LQWVIVISVIFLLISLCVPMTDGGAKDLTASSASPSALEAEIRRRGKDSQKIKPRKEREARVPEYLPSVGEVVEPEEVAAAPDAWWPWQAHGWPLWVPSGCNS
jgi:hypothetical protein